MQSRFVINLDTHESGAFAAASYLAALKEGVSFHEQRDCRHSLGIYNLSIARICDKIQKCASFLETRFTGAQCGQVDIVDYLELCLYAAAEHIDDVELIAKCFFKDDKSFGASREVRRLKDMMKPLRYRITSYINKIKHEQGRLRLFEAEVVHDKQKALFVGFYVEGFSGGVVGPNKILHGAGETIVSVTSFLWSILIFLELISREICQFLEKLSLVSVDRVQPVKAVCLSSSAISLARLPLYIFDDTHPFSVLPVTIESSPETTKKLESGLYGSIKSGWSKSNDFQVIGCTHASGGDGASRSFSIVQPKTIGLSHWQ